jgi:hypothetical protein
MSWRSIALSSVALGALSGRAAPATSHRKLPTVFNIPYSKLTGHFSELSIAAPLADCSFDPEPYPTKPRLVFRPDGTFKLTIFSDLHFGEGPEVDWGPEQDRNSSRLMRTVLGDDKPDYV